MSRTGRVAEQLNGINREIKSPLQQVLDVAEDVTLLPRRESSFAYQHRENIPSEQSTLHSSSSDTPKVKLNNGNNSLSQTRLEKTLAPYAVGCVDKFKISHWLYEIGAIVLSVGSFAAVIGVLIRQNNKPLSDWHFPTSINTVVSVLGTISRSSLAFAVAACLGQQKWSWHHEKPSTLALFKNFDNATRGPLGGGQLLFALRGGYVVKAFHLFCNLISFPPSLHSNEMHKVLD
jgi:hypothetical protein